MIKDAFAMLAIHYDSLDLRTTLDFTNAPDEKDKYPGQRDFLREIIFL
jgi:hypothetical protein